jgi:hypothetical protein
MAEWSVSRFGRSGPCKITPFINVMNDLVSNRAGLVAEAKEKYLCRP